MRKLSVVMAALFLLGSAPAFAQTSGSTEQKSETKTETPSGGESTTTTKKTSKKHHKKTSKKHKAESKGMESTGAPDGGM
jgi:uncharacterized protein YdeI (BOF family)